MTSGFDGILEGYDKGRGRGQEEEKKKKKEMSSGFVMGMEEKKLKGGGGGRGETEDSEHGTRDGAARSNQQAPTTQANAACIARNKQDEEREKRKKTHTSFTSLSQKPRPALFSLRLAS